MTHLNSEADLKILVLEPYYGGSHKSFLSGLSNLPFKFEFMTFPARKWKWRMRLSAPHYANKLHMIGKKYDRILCSTFVDVATFRGLSPAWVNNVPVLTYFHENQFSYPTRINDERDFHFALTNTTTALSSDYIAFNSMYNLNSFLHGIDSILKKSYDMKLSDPCDHIRKKSRIIPPGIDFSIIDKTPQQVKSGPVTIVWNHRWEHDKNPELFFKTILNLKESGADFKLILLGESFRECPDIFKKAEIKLTDNILHSGYVKSRHEYAEWLRKGDIIVSTADHEFFGISVIEAVRAGCIPLLPMKLSYPELFPEKYLYRKKDLTGKLKTLLNMKQRLSHDSAKELTDTYSWDSLTPLFKSWILDARRD